MTGSMLDGGGPGQEQPYSGTDVLDDMALLPRYHQVVACELMRSCARSGGRDVLDFGAGTGSMAERVQAAGYRVLCVEADAALRGRIGKRGLTATPCLDGLQPGTFDCVYSLNVLEHLQDDRDWVRRLWALLRPGGLFHIYVPAFTILYSPFDRSIGHLRRYSRRRGQDLFREPDAEIKTCVYRDVGGFFVALLFRILARRGADRPAPGALRFYDRWVVGLNRILDPLLGRFLGKNLLMVVRKGGCARGSCDREADGPRSTCPERKRP